MKCFNKLMVFFVFMLFGYGVDTLAWAYEITNQTGGDVKVQLYWSFGKLNEQADLIEAGAMRRFSFASRSTHVLCLTQIMASTKKSGKWGRQKEVKVENRSGKIISISTGGCGNKAFILKRVSGEIVATML